MSASPSNDADNSVRQTRIVFWVTAVVLGLLQAWANRHFISSDGISYLDMGDAFARHDWRMFVNAWWSPLYPALLGLAETVLQPSPYWEFTTVHLVNFAVYLFALAGFEFFLRQLVADRRRLSSAEQIPAATPEWALWAVGYVLFLWSSLSLISLQTVSPDMLMSAFVYLAAGLVLRIRGNPRSWLNFALLGAVLGLAYLSKAPMFPLAFVFLGVTLFLSSNIRHMAVRTLLAMVVFVLVTALWISALSRSKGRFTFGDSGKLNYLFYVNKAGPFWFWQDVGTGGGRFIHTTRKIFDDPTAYEFATPIRGTQPVWYDPSYWGEGGVPKFRLRGQLWVLEESLNTYMAIWPGALAVGLLVLCFCSGRKWRCLSDMAEPWPVWIPAVAALGMYALVLVQSRYVGVFLTLLWLGLYSGVRPPQTQDSRRIWAGVSVGIVVVMAIPLLVSGEDDLIKSAQRVPHRQWEVAQQLRQMGIQPGDRVARIGGTRAADWARMLHASVVAEIPYYAAEEFWASPPALQDNVLRALTGTGAKAVVAQAPANFSPPGWQPLAEAGYFVCGVSRPVPGQAEPILACSGASRGAVTTR